MKKNRINGIRVGIQGKILLLIISILSVSNLLQFALANYGIKSSGEKVSREVLTWKLGGDLISMRRLFREIYGSASLDGGILTGEGGRAIGGDNDFVDGIGKDYGITATLFALEGDDFVRVSTNIRDAAGDRVIGTKLGKGSAAYEPVLRGETYLGNADILGISYLTGYDPIFDGANRIVGILYLGIPEDNINRLITSSASANLRFQGLLALVILGVISGISFFLARSIVGPIRMVSGSLNVLAQGEGDLTTSLDVTSRDESGQVAASFNTFVTKLRILMEEVKEIISHTDDIKFRVSSSTEETSASVEEISSNLSAIGSQIEALNNNISDTAASIEEISRNIQSMDDRITDQSSMVEESSAAIIQMITSLGNVSRIAEGKRATTRALTEVAGKGKVHIGETAVAFKSVVNHINQIQEMASAINNIASQTNLLSMNAAIEAAHAGEAGRGFSVVAEEIRKLADSASLSSRSISQLIKDITGAIMETDRNVTTTTEAFDEIAADVNDTVNAFTEIEHSVSELNTGGRQILEATNRINDITAGIRDGSAEIKSSTGLMLQGSTLIREISRQVRDGMDESLIGVREILGSMEQMVEMTGELDTVVGQLKRDFGRFKTA